MKTFFLVCAAALLASCSSMNREYGGEDAAVAFSYTKDESNTLKGKSASVEGWILNTIGWAEIKGREITRQILNEPLDSVDRQSMLNDFKRKLDLHSLTPRFRPDQKIYVPHGIIYYVLVQGPKLVVTPFDSVQLGARKQAPKL